MNKLLKYLGGTFQVIPIYKVESRFLAYNLYKWNYTGRNTKVAPKSAITNKQKRFLGSP